MESSVNPRYREVSAMPGACCGHGADSSGLVNTTV